MSKHLTSKGKVIDMESIIAQQGDAPAIGNMPVNGKGDLIGPGGQIIKTADQRARDHYKNVDGSESEQVSIKNAQPAFGGVNAEPSDLSPEVKTAATGKSEAKVKPDPVVKQEPVKEEVKMQEEKDVEELTKTQVAKSKAQAQSKEPIGYKEVELPNGDIEMVPIFEDDWEDDA